jgi:hypothetical protein
MVFSKARLLPHHSRDYGDEIKVELVGPSIALVKSLVDAVSSARSLSMLLRNRYFEWKFSGHIRSFGAFEKAGIFNATVRITSSIHSTPRRLKSTSTPC